MLCHDGPPTNRLQTPMIGVDSVARMPRAASAAAGPGLPTLERRKAETGSVAPSRQGRPAGSGRLAAHVITLVGWVAAAGDITMAELAARLLAEKAVTVHPASLSRFLRVQGFGLKKRCWRALPIALVSSVPGGCGPDTASHR